MSRSPAPPPPDAHGGDVASIGSHCSLPTCHRLDFLPFLCGSCNSTFCLDHRSETAHSCPKAGAWAQSQRPAPSPSTSSASTSTKPPLKSLLETTCALPKCKTTIHTTREPGVNCTVCRKQYCLAHRLQDRHDCKPPPPPPGQVAKEKAVEKIKTLSGWKGLFSKSGSKENSSSSAASSKATNPFSGLVPSRSGPASAADVIKMKRAAKGDEKIPTDKRIYLYVEAEARTTTAKMPRGVFWFSKEWTVGRTLDVAAKMLMVQNVNNQGDDEEKRLRVFHVEGGRVLSFGEKLGDAVVSGNTVVMLRGLGVGQDMIEL